MTEPPDTGLPASTEDRPQDRVPGLTTFSFESRTAPALFVVAWIGTIFGLALIYIGTQAGDQGARLVFVLLGLVITTAGLLSAAGSQAIERRTHGAVYAGPSPVLAFAAAVPLIVLLVAFAAVGLSIFRIDPVSPAGVVVTLLATTVGYLIVVAFAVVGAGALTWAEMGVRPPTSLDLSAFATGLAFAIPTIFVTGTLALLLTQVLTPAPSPLPPATDVPGKLANFIAGAAIAPVGEEILFRGFATTAWLRQRGPRQAIVLGGLLFALAHTLDPALGAGTFSAAAQQAGFAFLVRLPVAFALGWIFIRSRSLYGSIGLHAGFNGIPLLFILLGLAPTTGS